MARCVIADFKPKNATLYHVGTLSDFLQVQPYKLFKEIHYGGLILDSTDKEKPTPTKTKAVP